MRSETVTPARRTHARRGSEAGFSRGAPSCETAPAAQAGRAVPVSGAAMLNTTNKLSILCGLTLELSGRCGRDGMIVAQTTPQRSVLSE